MLNANVVKIQHQIKGIDGNALMTHANVNGMIPQIMNIVVKPDDMIAYISANESLVCLYSRAVFTFSSVRIVFDTLLILWMLFNLSKIPSFFVFSQSTTTPNEFPNNVNSMKAMKNQFLISTVYM